MSKRLRSYSPTTIVKKAKMLDPTLAIHIGSQSVGTQSGALPVTLGGGQIVKLPPVRFKRPKVGIGSRVKRNANVVVYRYQASTPWHAPNCANLLVNGLGAAVADTSDGVQRSLSGCLYDLTSAPNYVDKPNTSGLANDSRLRTGNIPVAYRPIATTNYNFNTGNECRFYTGYSWFTKYDIGVNALGRESGNCWQLEYQKKPLKMHYENSQLSLGMQALVPGGIPNYGTTDGAPQQVRLPVVGAKPVLRKTNIQLTLQGESTTPVEYEVMIFAVDSRMAVVPEYVDLNEDVQQDVSTVYQAIGGGSLGFTQGTPEANEYIKFWTNFWGQFCDDPGTVDHRVVAKYCRPIKSRRFTIDPKTSIENDSIGHCKTVRFDLNWNKVMNYGWRPHDVTNNNVTAQVKGGTIGAEVNGPGFATNIKNKNTFDCMPHPGTRLYMAVRCRQKVQMSTVISDSVGSCVDVTGAGTFGSLDFSKGVTYDVLIRNTFEIDE